MPALNMTGRDHRIPDSGKARIACHKAAAKVSVFVSRSQQNSSQEHVVFCWCVCKVVVMIARGAPSVSPDWGDSVGEESNSSRHHSRESIGGDGGDENDTDEDDADDEKRSSPRKSRRRSSLSQGGGSPESSTGLRSKKGRAKKGSATEAEAGDQIAQSASHLPAPYLCVVGALQRVVVCVPDRVPTRSAALDSVIEVLSVLQNPSVAQLKPSKKDKGTGTDRRYGEW